MPLILTKRQQFDAWLDTDKHDWDKDVTALLTSPPSDEPDAEELDMYAVPKEVGKVGTNSPDYIKVPRLPEPESFREVDEGFVFSPSPNARVTSRASSRSKRKRAPLRNLLHPRLGRPWKKMTSQR